MYCKWAVHGRPVVVDTDASNTSDSVLSDPRPDRSRSARKLATAEHDDVMKAVLEKCSEHAVRSSSATLQRPAADKCVQMRFNKRPMWSCTHSGWLELIALFKLRTRTLPQQHFRQRVRLHIWLHIAVKPHDDSDGTAVVFIDPKGRHTHRVSAENRVRTRNVYNIRPSRSLGCFVCWGRDVSYKMRAWAKNLVDRSDVCSYEKYGSFTISSGDERLTPTGCATSHYVA